MSIMNLPVRVNSKCPMVSDDDNDDDDDDDDGDDDGTGQSRSVREREGW